MDLGLKGKGVLVTGWSKGIGLAIAELFAAEGANVAICARNADEVGKVVKALATKGSKSWGKAIDVADPVALKQWVEGAAAELGGIDTIVCNVSALAVGDTPDTWEKSFRTDMMHTVNSVAAALPYLEKSKSASIVIVSSSPRTSSIVRRPLFRGVAPGAIEADAIGGIRRQEGWSRTAKQSRHGRGIRRIAAEQAMGPELPQVAWMDVAIGRLRQVGHVVGIDQPAPESFQIVLPGEVIEQGSQGSVTRVQPLEELGQFRRLGLGHRCQWVKACQDKSFLVFRELDIGDRTLGSLRAKASSIRR